MLSSNDSHSHELLTSWKEIASYLGKGVRTVQRWEQQFGLPVRRPNEKAKGIVHATRQELDQWLEMQWSQRPKEFGLAYAMALNWHEQVRTNLLYAIELRNANRRLLADVKTSLDAIFLECQSMARNMTGTPPPPARMA